VQEAADAGLAAGKSFKQAVSGMGVKVQAAEPFTGLSGSSSTNPAVQSLVQAVVAYNPGEVADPVRSEDGLIVAYLKARTPADPTSYDAYRDEIANAIRGRRAQGLFQDWQAEFLSPERFVDLQRPTVTDDQEEGGDEAAEDAPAATDENAAATEPDML
jgi:hypothetical protein